MEISAAMVAGSSHCSEGSWDTLGDVGCMLSLVQPIPLLSLSLTHTHARYFLLQLIELI